MCIKLLLSILPLFLLGSCASTLKKGDVGCDACARHFESIQTREQGISDAKKNVREKGFRIIRYDMPGIRTGYWEPYYRPFKHFGIEESTDWVATLEYCKGFNYEMDRQLKKRYGAEYARLRSEIMPKPGSKRYAY